MQAALYTGVQPVGGHYRELPDEMFNLSIVHLIGSAPGKRRGIEIVNLFPAFKCCAAGISIVNENFRIRVDVKKKREKTSRANITVKWRVYRGGEKFYSEN